MTRTSETPRPEARRQRETRAPRELKARIDVLEAELAEALEQQTATAEVLQVINSSPGDLAPVFDAILEKALSLCGAAFGNMLTWDGEFSRLVASRGASAKLEEALREPSRPVPGSMAERIVGGQNVISAADLLDEESYRVGAPGARRLVELGGARGYAIVALRKEDELLGVISIYRREPLAFTEKQIALLENFAAQAVIAMENARLITETREALEQQTATAEVLGVINSSPGNLAPVFEAMLERATRLCEPAAGLLTSWDGERFHRVASRGMPPEFMEAMREPSIPPPGSPGDRLIRGENIVCISDLAEVERIVDDGRKKVHRLNQREIIRDAKHTRVVEGLSTDEQSGIGFHGKRGQRAG